MRVLTDTVTLHEDTDRELRIVAKPRYGPDFLALLQGVEFGSEGVRYRRLGLAEQLQRLPAATFLELREKGRLLGTYALSTCSLRIGDEQMPGVYRGLLALAPEARGRGLGGHVVKRTFDWLATQSGGRPLLSWGCIESNNHRSRLALESAGAVRLGSLESLLSYRQWPRERIEIEEQLNADAVTIALQQSYADCGVQAIDGCNERYFAVTRANEIVAGARATVTHVDMLSSGSIWDSLYNNVLRRVPAARRRYDPRRFRYLRLTDVVIKKGHEGLWRDFLSTLLARHEAHMAMFVMDPKGAAYCSLQKAGLFGLFAASTRQRIDVLANAWNMPADQLQHIADRPLAVGPLDI